MEGGFLSEKACKKPEGYRGDVGRFKDGPALSKEDITKKSEGLSAISDLEGTPESCNSTYGGKSLSDAIAAQVSREKIELAVFGLPEGLIGDFLDIASYFDQNVPAEFDEDAEEQLMNGGVEAFETAEMESIDALVLVNAPQDNLAMVAMEEPPPLNMIPITPAYVDKNDGMESEERRDEAKIRYLVNDCGMDFNIPIGAVFQEFIANKRLEKKKTDDMDKAETIDIVAMD
ncbi:hypothetical protein AMTR_s00065p00195400 [Amborella trichopoda]|uniref:Uncharacterized protein n=1 Tax=Amborella trichopoda TaxID=13333 RepID=U5CZ96_AMBTC|nr:hypothetical protein AMTR_s00065p00195400 [Amborella trichopoda]